MSSNKGTQEMSSISPAARKRIGQLHSQAFEGEVQAKMKYIEANMVIDQVVEDLAQKRVKEILAQEGSPKKTVRASPKKTTKASSQKKVAKKAITDEAIAKGVFRLLLLGKPVTASGIAKQLGNKYMEDRVKAALDKHVTNKDVTLRITGTGSNGKKKKHSRRYYELSPENKLTSYGKPHRKLSAA